MISIKTFDLKNTCKAVVVAFVGVALAVSMVWPTQTRAQTYSVAELQSLLNQILIQLNALQGNTGVSGVCPYVWQRNLGIGSTGPDVMRLQQFLNSFPDTRLAVSGAGSPGMETQYYGPITAAAVSRFQVKYRAEVLTPINLVNPTAYFGAMSRAKANSLCTTVVTPGQPPVDNDDALRGGAGSIDDISLISGLSNEEVGEGQNNVEVMGLEFEAVGSDIEISAVNVDFDHITASGNFDRYADNVSIWLNGERYATVDASQFTRSNNYGRTITLDRGAIVRQGDTAELVVAVSGVRNLDSSRFGDTWDVGIDSLRFRDAQGAIITENMSGQNQTSTVGSFERAFSFEEFSRSVGLEVVLRNGDSDINNSRSIEVSSTRNTDNVPVLSFLVDVNGASDVEIYEMPITINTTGGDVDDIVSAAYLYLDNDRVASENINSNSNTVVFDNLNLVLDGNQTHEFEVRLDLRAANNTNYSSGATVDVDILHANFDNWGIEDERGNNVSTNDRRGSASADPHTLVTQGARVQLISSSGREVYNSNNPSSSYGEYRMVVEITAIGDTIYVPQTVTRDDTPSTSAGLTYHFEDSAGNEYTAGTGTESFSRISGGTIQGNLVRINEGQSARFELVATLDPDAFGQYRVQLVSVAWNDTDASPDEYTVLTPENNFRSGLQVISN